MKMRCLGLLLASATISVYGMQGEPKKGLSMLTKNGYIMIPQPVVDASQPLTNIQNMNKNDFFRRTLLIDQKMIVVQALIKDQERILARESVHFQDKEPNPYRSIADMLHYLAVSKRLKLNELLNEYKKIVSDTKQ